MCVWNMPIFIVKIEVEVILGEAKCSQWGAFLSRI